MVGPRHVVFFRSAPTIMGQDGGNNTECTTTYPAPNATSMTTQHHCICAPTVEPPKVGAHPLCNKHFLTSMPIPPGDRVWDCYFFHLATVSRIFLSKQLCFSLVVASLVDCGLMVLLASKTNITTTFPLVFATPKGGSWITTPTKSTSCSHN